MKNKKLFYIVTTIPSSLYFFKGQLSYLSNDFDMVAISSDECALENLVMKKVLGRIVFQ